MWACWVSNLVQCPPRVWSRHHLCTLCTQYSFFWLHFLLFSQKAPVFIQMVYKAPHSFKLSIKTWVVAIIFLLLQFISISLLVKNLKTILCPQKIRKTTHRFFFSLLPQTTQIAQTKEFWVQIMAYRPTIYKAGLFSQLNIRD